MTPRVQIRMIEEIPETPDRIGQRDRPGRRLLTVDQDGDVRRYAIHADAPIAEINVDRMQAGDEFDRLWVEHGGQPSPMPTPTPTDNEEVTAGD